MLFSAVPTKRPGTTISPLHTENEEESHRSRHQGDNSSSFLKTTAELIVLLDKKIGVCDITKTRRGTSQSWYSPTKVTERRELPIFRRTQAFAQTSPSQVSSNTFITVPIFSSKLSSAVSLRRIRVQFENCQRRIYPKLESTRRQRGSREGRNRRTRNSGVECRQFS